MEERLVGFRSAWHARQRVHTNTTKGKRQKAKDQHHHQRNHVKISICTTKIAAAGKRCTIFSFSFLYVVGKLTMFFGIGPMPVALVRHRHILLGARIPPDGARG